MSCLNTFGSLDGPFSREKEDKAAANCKGWNPTGQTGRACEALHLLKSMAAGSNGFENDHLA